MNYLGNLRESIEFDDPKRRKTHEHILIRHEENVSRERRKKEQDKRKFASMKIMRKDPENTIFNTTLNNNIAFQQKNKIAKDQYVIKHKPANSRKGSGNQTSMKLHNNDDSSYITTMIDENNNKKNTHSKKFFNVNHIKVTGAYPIIKEQHREKRSLKKTLKEIEYLNLNSNNINQKVKQDNIFTNENNEDHHNNRKNSKDANKIIKIGNGYNKHLMNFNEINSRLANNKGAVFDLKNHQQQQFVRNWKMLTKDTDNSKMIDMIEKNGMLLKSISIRNNKFNIVGNGVGVKPTKVVKNKKE